MSALTSFLLLKLLSQGFFFKGLFILERESKRVRGGVEGQGETLDFRLCAEQEHGACHWPVSQP